MHNRQWNRTVNLKKYKIGDTTEINQIYTQECSLVYGKEDTDTELGDDTV